jgi:hypothetical protein
MKFEVITEDVKVHPGEYVLHEPSQEIVMCGAFNRKLNFIRAIGRGQSVKDEIANFRKIVLNKEEMQESRASRCKGCSG